MRRVKRFILIFLFLAITIAVLSFVLENQKVVALSFFGWQSSQYPISAFVVIALVAGMIIGSVSRVGFFYRSSKRGGGTQKI